MLVAVALFAVSAVVQARVDGDDGDGGDGGEGESAAAVVALPATAVSTPTAQPQAVPAVEMTGFVMPVVGACLPSSDLVLPGAPREYRNGVHEGVDLYDGVACASIGRGTEVVAARAGVVTRADLEYRPLTAEEALRSDSAPATLDRFRGRQVWIDHGAGATGERVVTRYAHLDGIAFGVSVGAKVQAGQLIAYVGNSGTPESVYDPTAQHHLHFEVRVGDGYLGDGKEPEAVRKAYERLFSGGRE